MSDALFTSIWPPSSRLFTPDRTSGVTSVSRSRVSSSYLRASKFFLAPSTSRPVLPASRATSSADMYLVTTGTRSARAAASRRPPEFAIAPWIRSAPNAVASTSGTSTIARTFHRTGQLLSDQAGGRLAGAGSAWTCGDSDRTASAAWAGRANMVTSPRPRDRPLR
ncbi:hypothetical protein A5680_18715 [Mycobacterium sp. E2989]|nr:hypothetical protein A5680_18715 [Mycobacterium sp. E2989]